MNRRTRFGAAVGAALMAAALTAPAAAAGNDRVDVIVVYTDGVSNSSATTAAMARQYDAAPRWVYEHALEGFAGSVPEGRLNGLRHDPRVDYVELDQEVSIAAQTVPTGVRRIFADDNTHLDIDGSDDRRIDVDVAVIDTGIDLDHADLNVVDSTNCLNHSGGPPFNRTYSCDGTGDDGNGHGTHVAGTIGAIDDGNGVVGVAPGARLHGVRVLDDNGSGALGAVVAGIDWVTARADIIEVANMSLGCECSSEAMDQAIAVSVDNGVAYAVAAGNSDADASTFSPANHPDVITVSALADFDGEPGGAGSPTCRTDQDDTLAAFSNFGSLVEIAAPGVCILSTWNDGGYNTISGTSMASPHVAGAAALLAASGTTDPGQVRSTIMSTGSFDWTDDSGDGVQEPLLDLSDTTAYDPATTTGSGDGGDGGGTNSPPTASFTYTCADLVCDFDGSGSSDSDGSVAIYDWDFSDGNTGSGETVSHTFGADGDYTVTLTVTDDDSATGTDTQVVRVSSGGDGGGDETGLHVESMSATTSSSGPEWSSTLTVLVHDGDGAAGSVTVTVSWLSERGVSDSASCTTSSDGTCSVGTLTLHKRDAYVDYTVDTLTSGDTVVNDGSTLRVFKP